MSEIKKLNELIEQVDRDKVELQKQINEQENNINLLRIKYHDNIVNDDDKTADDIQQKIEKESRLLQRLKDKQKLLNESVINKDIEAQGDKAVDEAISIINDVKAEQRKIIDEYSQLFVQVSKLKKEYMQLKAKGNRYNRIALKLGEKFPTWAIKNGNYRDSNNLPNRPPTISFKGGSSLGEESLYKIEQKHITNRGVR